MEDPQLDVEKVVQFKRQCTQEFCAVELKEIKEFGTWVEKMITS
jgi:hypothetical protein